MTISKSPGDDRQVERILKFPKRLLNKVAGRLPELLGELKELEENWKVLTVREAVREFNKIIKQKEKTNETKPV